MKQNYCVGSSLAAILIAYVVLSTLIGRFSGFDEPYFKSAGREWGQHGRFASPELTGFLPGVDPPPEKIYFVYPPLYSFLFGVLVRVAGFGWRQCILYDAVIHATLSSLTYGLAQRLGGDRLPRRAALLAALAVLPLGMVWGRPDEMAMVFGLSGLLVAMGGPIGPARATVSGSIFGLCAGTSVGTAVMMGCIAFAVLAIEPVRWPKRFVLCIAWGLAAGAVLALIIAPILIPHPRAIEQYRAIAKTQISVGNVVQRFFGGFQFKRHLILGMVPILLIGLWLSLSTLKTGGYRRWLSLWLGPLLSMAFFFITIPQKATYLWFLGPWLIAATAAELALSWTDLPSWRRGAVALGLAAALVLGSEPTIKEYVSLAGMPASQRPEVNERILSSLIPPGRSVLTLDSWWFLARDHDVYDGRWACIPPEEVDFVVLSGNGSGAPGRPLSFDLHCGESFPLEKNYQPIADNLNRHVPTFLGKAITNSGYGFGNFVLRRNPVELESAADPGSRPTKAPGVKYH